MGRYLKNSLLLGAIQLLKAGWRTSRVRSLAQGFFNRQDPAETSRYRQFLEGLASWLARLGQLADQSWLASSLGSFQERSRPLLAGSRLQALTGGLPLHRVVLLAFALYLPLGQILVRLSGSGFVDAIWEEAFILLAVFWVFWRACRGSRTLARATSLEVTLLLFMAVGLLLMLLNRPYPAVALSGYRAQVQYMVWFFLVLRLLEEERDGQLLYLAFAALVLLLCFHGIYQYLVGVPIPASWVTKTELGVRTRVFSLTGSPNIFGSLIVMGAPMMAAGIYYLAKPLWKLAAFLATAVACLCILFTFSRGAWVGLVVAVTLFSILVDGRILALMSAAVAAVLVFVPSIQARLTYLFTSDYAEASAIGGRAMRWELGRNLLMENSPWLGFGLGRFGGAVAMNHQILDETETFRYFYLDNYYLKTLVEMGYLGLFFFLLVLAVFFWTGLWAYSRSGRLPEGEAGRDLLFRQAGSPRLLVAGIFSGLSGVLVHCFFENIFEETYMMAYFYGLAALMAFLGYRPRVKEPVDDRIIVLP